MPWLSRKRYADLLRTANNKMVTNSAFDELNQRLTKLAVLMWRLDPALTSSNLWHHPFEFMQAHETGDTVVVFVVHKGKPIIFEDLKSMFPSDELVAKLRILLT